MSDTILQLQGVAKHFGATPAVDGVTLDIARGEFRALRGPSGGQQQRAEPASTLRCGPARGRRATVNPKL
jgi:ABC-type Fe3+/spermidine/putrescine transport system ATPase subunit